jgi:hypothetical protein
MKLKSWQPRLENRASEKASKDRLFSSFPDSITQGFRQRLKIGLKHLNYCTGYLFII